MAEFSADVFDQAVRVGPLAYGGDFDAYGAYPAGTIALDTGVPYIATSPVDAQLTAQDTFRREDDPRWGLSTAGEQWDAYPQAGDDWTAEVIARQGVINGQADSNQGAVLLSDVATAATDREVLALVEVDTEAVGNLVYPVAILGSDSDQQNQTAVAVQVDGINPAGLAMLNAGQPASGGAYTATALTPTLGQSFWLRARQANGQVQARIWLPGTDEPNDWPLTVAATGGQWGERAGVGMGTAGAPGQVAFNYVSLRDVATSPAPSADPANWIDLTAAFGPPVLAV